MRKEYLGPVTERQQETLMRCEHRILTLAELIGDLLKIGRERTEMGREQLRSTPLEPVLQPLIPLCQDQSAEKGLEIAFDIADPLPKVLAHEGLIEDLLMNLINNAIKYTLPGGG